MFGTEIKFLTFLFILIQGLLLIPALIFWIKDSKEGQKSRYFVLTLLFLLYNITSGLTPDENLKVDRIAQDITAWSVGIICAIYFLYYLYKEFNIKPIKSLTIELIIKILALDFIFFFILPYITTEDLKFSRNLFLILPLIIGVSAFFNSFYHLYNDYNNSNNKYYKVRIMFGCLALLSIALFPLTIVIFGDNQIIEHSTFNMGYFAVSVAYVLRINYINHIDTNLKSQILDSDEKRKYKNLNYYEKELLFLLLNNPNKEYDQLLSENNLETKHLEFLPDKIFILLNSLNSNSSVNIEFINYQKFKEFDLTTRELEIASLILKDKNYNLIAEELFIAPSTVSKHASNIFKKVKVLNKEEFKSTFYAKSVEKYGT